MNNKVSVIIITKDRPKYLFLCLSSLTTQSLPPSEVIIVDNSSISQKKLINTFKKKLPIRYKYQENLTIPQLRMIGMHHASHNIVLTLDDDCIAKKNWVEQMVNLHNIYPSTTAISASVIHIPQYSIYSLIIKTVRQQRTRLIDEVDDPIHLDTSNCLFVKNHLRKLGVAFDPFLIRGSDSDIGAQIAERGGQTIVVKKTTAYHHERSTLWEFLKQRFKNGMATKRLASKWLHRTLYFYIFHKGSYIKPFFRTIYKLVKKRKFVIVVKFITIVSLATVVHELGYHYQTTLQYTNALKRKYKS